MRAGKTRGEMTGCEAGFVKVWGAVGCDMIEWLMVLGRGRGEWAIEGTSAETARGGESTGREMDLFVAARLTHSGQLESPSHSARGKGECPRWAHNVLLGLWVTRGDLSGEEEWAGGGTAGKVMWDGAPMARPGEPVWMGIDWCGS